MENTLKLGYEQAGKTGGGQRISYFALYVFTLLLYLRPQELFATFFGDFPLVKIVAILALATYVFGRIVSGERVTIWPIELKMLSLICALGLLFAFVARSPADSFDVLTDTLLKVVAVFVLMINLIDSRERLLQVIRLVVIVCAFMAVGACLTYAEGKFTPKTFPPRIQGIVNGIFGNPNDLATSLDLALPLAIALALWNRGLKRLFYFGCALALGLAVVMTFSRGGFLGLLAIALFFLFKLARHRAGAIALIAGSMILLFAVAPGGYGSRLSSILHANQDETGSSQARIDLLSRATELVVTHPIVGLGLGNFHIYSIAEQRAHNAYLEIGAELGIIGLIAYLIILFNPFRYLRKIELATRPGEVATRNSWDSRAGPPPPDERSADQVSIYYLSLGIQGGLIAYAVCSFFGSVQYIWDLYYIVAYAVALRAIVPLAAPAQAAAGNGLRLVSSWGATKVQPVPAVQKGALWNRPAGLVRSPGKRTL
ncbi:MAG TPA: O-antigen ligase family protein [Blastocatellia bacterium]